MAAAEEVISDVRAKKVNDEYPQLDVDFIQVLQDQDRRPRAISPIRSRSSSNPGPRAARGNGGPKIGDAIKKIGQLSKT